MDSEEGNPDLKINGCEQTRITEIRKCSENYPTPGLFEIDTQINRRVHTHSFNKKKLPFQLQNHKTAMCPLYRY